MNKRVTTDEAFPPMDYGGAEPEPETFAVPLHWTSKDVLRAIYLGETGITKRQQQAARDVLAFEHPRLAVVQNIGDGGGFAAQLEAARKRSEGAKVIEGRSVRIEAPVPVPEPSAAPSAKGFRRI